MALPVKDSPVREELIEKLVCRDRGDEQYGVYRSESTITPEVLTDAIQKTLASVPPSFGSCVMISSALVTALQVYYSVSSIAVLGDLAIDGCTVFKCQGNLPFVNGQSNEFINEQWSGHCWVEIGSLICDLSIFRSAYAITRPSKLRDFIESNFGSGKGALISPVESLPDGMEFTPKFVLNDLQLSGILGGLEHQQKNAI